MNAENRLVKIITLCLAFFFVNPFVFVTAIVHPL
jgi:hypothetical protein